MTTTPKIDTTAPEQIWTNGLGCYGADDFGGTPYIRRDLADARAAAAWIAGRDAAADSIKLNPHDGWYDAWKRGMRDHIRALTPPADTQAALDRLIAERCQAICPPDIPFEAR